MRMLRWGMLALYAALVIGLLVIGLWPDNDLGALIVVLIAVGSQLIFLLGAGHRDLCRPIRRPRLLLPVTMAALMLAVLTFGLTLALAELVKLKHENPGGVFLWGCLAVSWIVWSVLLFAHTRDLGRFQAIQRLARYVFTGSLAEMLAGIPAHIFVERRGGCFAGIGTSIGIFAGLGVMLWSFGPAILLLFLQPAYEREHDDSPIRDRPARPRRSDYQFRLRTLLAVTVALSVILALLKSMWGQWLGASLAAVLVIYLAVTVLMRIPVVLILVAVAVHAGLIWFMRDNWLSLTLFVIPSILLSLPILWFFTRSSPDSSS